MPEANCIGPTKRSRYRITGMGGNDTQTKFSASQLGQPVSRVFAKPGSLSSVLDGVKNHRIKISSDLEYDFNYLSEGIVLLSGTEVKNNIDINLDFTLKIKDSSEMFNLKIIENGKLIKEKKTQPGETTRIHWVWKSDSSWIRAEIRDSKNQIRGYINPLHRGEKAHSLLTWGDALEHLKY